MYEKLGEFVFEKVVDETGWVSGALYGYYSNKKKSIGKIAVAVALWGIAGKILPIPVLAYTGYKNVTEFLF